VSTAFIIFTRVCLQSSSDSAFRKSRIEEWRGSMVSLQTRPSKKRFLTEQVRRLRARFAQSVDTLLGEVIPAELLKQWVLEEVVQWGERLYGPLTTLMLFIEQVMSGDHGCQEA